MLLVRRGLGQEERLQDWHAHEEGVLNRLRQDIRRFAAPTVQLGFGRASLGHKWQVVMHALFLISSDMETLSAMVASVPSWVSDYGVEIALSRIPPISAQAVFPYMENPAAVFGTTDEVDFTNCAESLWRRRRPSPSRHLSRG